MKPIDDKDEVKELGARAVALRGRWLLARALDR